MKFQWSKVASVLGSYQDFIHAYGMSINSANFSEGQIAAQLDTINRKYEQLKATMTGIATGIGASGLSAYIKNILSSLNAFAKAIQKVPTNVWKAVGAVTAFVAAIGSGVVILKLFAGGISALVAGYGAYTSAVAAGTLATEGWAVATTVATGGLNILLAVLAAGVAAFLGYNAIVSQSIKTSDDLAQKGADAITAKEQEIQAMEKQTEWIATLCESHVKLQEELETTKEGTEQNIRAKEDLAATDNELAEVIGKNAVDKIDWSRNVQDVIRDEQAVIRNKIADEKKQLADAKLAQLNYTRNQVEWTKNRIEALKSEGYGWDALKDVIENFVHFLGRAMVTMGESFNAFQDTIRSTPILGKIAQMMGYGDEGSLSRNVANGMVSTGNELQSFSGDYAQTAVDAFKRVPIIGQIAQWDIDHLLNFDENGFNGLRGGLFNSHSNRWNELEYQEEELKRLENQERQENIDYLGQEIKNYDNTDSGVVDEGAGGGNKKGSSPRSGAGAKEADNSPMAMSYRYLKGKGLDENFIAGLLGNAIRESGGWDLNPDADNGSHRGLFQWDYNDYSRTGRWYDFIDSFLKDRGISESQYYAMGKDQKRTLQLDFSVFEMFMGKERKAYEDMLKYDRPVTPEGWASAINQRYERSGEPAGSPIDYERQSNARQVHTKMARKNGEENYTDIDAQTLKDYKLAKQLYEDKLNTLTMERAKIGQGVSASEKKKLFEDTVNIEGFKHLKEAQKDYAKILIDAIKQERMRGESATKAAEMQNKAVEKMADGEIEFAEKIGLINKQDVRQYYRQKNEDNYHTKKPMMDLSLARTVDLSKGSANDMLEALQGLLDSQDNMEREMYAKRIFNLSRDVQATKKALDERLKLEQEYQEKRQQLAREEYEYNSRYTLKLIDSFTNAFQSGFEGILNRTKSFADAFRDIFKSVVNDIIKLFTEDWASRLKKVLANVLQQTKKTGNAAGTGYSKQNAGFNLVGWGMDNLSLLSGKMSKATKAAKSGMGSKGLFAETLINPQDMGYVKNSIGQMTNVAKQGAQSVATVSQQASAQALAVNVANNTAQTTAYTAMETTKTGVTTVQESARVATSNAAQATVMANLGAMMTQMLAMLAIMAVFGALFGGGGSKTETSTSSVNLGRSPDSYYMTPTPVMQSTTFNVPSFDIGGNIEQDMFAMVHKGEMVLTPEQADVIRNTARSGGSMGNSGSANASVKSNISVSTVDSRGFERVLRDYNRDLSKQVKKGIRNGYLNAKGLV